MRYRKEDKNGDYSFGRGEGDFFINTPEAVGMAVISRLQLRKGEWFLDTTAGTDWTQILGKYTSGLYDIVIRERILGTARPPDHGHVKHRLRPNLGNHLCMKTLSIRCCQK
ncbi:hypothetical protein [Serratia marcescens]|uniref:hypothetical protein n=1 Tax=Serratia marcescens TaxID=615 RepID=UPI003C77BF35